MAQEQVIGVSTELFLTCEYCNGTGEVEVVGDSVTDVCDKCGGTGFFCEMRTGDFCTLGSPCPHQKPLTNEEWFVSLPTEEKAKFIFWQHFDVYGKTLYELMVNASRGVSRDKQAEVMIGAVIEWLKEKHNEMSNV